MEDKLYVIAGLLLFFDTRLCVGMSVHITNSFSGDPAPGRSPGPPVGPQASAEEMIITSDLFTLQPSSTISNCELFPEPATTEKDPQESLNVTVDHDLFRTDLLSPGVVYKGKRRLSL